MRYAGAVMEVNTLVDMPRIVKKMMSITRALAMRSGYEAFVCLFASHSMETRFVSVDMDIMEDWKFVEIQLLLAKRAAK